MDRRTFESDTLAKVISEGFDGDVDSVIALMIFCLGEVAIDGLSGSPISERSGVRGGSISRPPGLALFNEARKCLGFVLCEHELENVQIFSLVAYDSLVLIVHHSSKLMIVCLECTIILAHATS